jgi:hypothetical protein
VTRHGPGLPPNHGNHAHWDVRDGLADGREHFEKRLTFRAEGQLSPMSRIRRRLGGCSSDTVTASGQIGCVAEHAQVLAGGPGSPAAGTGRRRGRRSHRVYGRRRPRADTAPDGHCDAQGAVLAEHENPGEATCMSCADESGCGRGPVLGGRPGDPLVVPDARPSREAGPASSAPGTAPTGRSASRSHLLQGAPLGTRGHGGGARSQARPGTAGWLTPGGAS